MPAPRPSPPTRTPVRRPARPPRRPGPAPARAAPPPRPGGGGPSAQLTGVPERACAASKDATTPARRAGVVRVAFMRPKVSATDASGDGLGDDAGVVARGRVARNGDRDGRVEGRR